ncbi:MAG: universal stress protein [Hyphomicrobiales bacterium]
MIPPLLVSPIPVDIIAEAQQQADERAKSAIARFKRSRGRRRRCCRCQGKVIAGAMTEVMTGTCRLTDLVVIGQDDPARPDPGRAQALEAVLFGASRPLLVVPLGFAGETSFGRVAIGWDGSSPAARAVVAALPFLAAAESVEVIAVDQPVEEGSDATADVVTYLSRHDIAAEGIHISSNGMGICRSLGRHVEEAGYSLLVMGGFGKTLPVAGKPVLEERHAKCRGQCPYRYSWPTDQQPARNPICINGADSANRVHSNKKTRGLGRKRRQER